MNINNDHRWTIHKNTWMCDGKMTELSAELCPTPETLYPSYIHWDGSDFRRTCFESESGGDVYESNDSYERYLNMFNFLKKGTSTFRQHPEMMNMEAITEFVEFLEKEVESMVSIIDESEELISHFFDELQSEQSEQTEETVIV